MTYLNEGLVQGRRQGVAAGYQRGYSEGYDEGFQKGSDVTGDAWENLIATDWRPALQTVRQERDAAKSVAKDLLVRLRAEEKQRKDAQAQLAAQKASYDAKYAALKTSYDAAYPVLLAVVSCLSHQKKEFDLTIFFQIYEHFKKGVFKNCRLNEDADFWRHGEFQQGDPNFAQNMQKHYEEFLEWKKAQATAEPA